jgi:acyl dehydratase
MKEIRFLPDSSRGERSLVCVTEAIFFEIAGAVNPFSFDAILAETTNFVHIAPTGTITSIFGQLLS